MGEIWGRYGGDMGEMWGPAPEVDLQPSLHPCFGRRLGGGAGLARRGVRVPEDLAVVGFDDNPDAEFYAPALTTVRVDVLGDARRCVAAVVGGVSLPSAPAQLIVRSSSAASTA